METGFVLLHRKFRDHWIVSDHKALSVFMQILMRVEWKEGKSVLVGRTEVKLRIGEMTFGIFQMAKWCGLTPQMVRTALDKLKSTSTITIKSTNKFSILYLENWQKYQSKQSDQQTNQQTSNKRATNDQLHLNNTITKQANKKRESLSFKKPSLEDCLSFFVASSSSKLEGEKFFYHFESNGWKVGGKSPMKNWNASALGWIRRNLGGNANGMGTKEKARPLTDWKELAKAQK